MIKQQSTHIKNKKGPMESSKRSSMSTTITNGSNNKSLTEGEEKPIITCDESLPKYSCSVHKVGIGHIKFEMNSIGKRPWRRPWRHVFMELRGTMLEIYEIKTYTPLYLPSFPSNYQQHHKYVHLISLSLARLQAIGATDYKKRSNVFRIKNSRVRLLIQVQTAAEMVSWMEKISAGNNIALDLDDRSHFK
ncbi:hypothetical protein G6F44_011177 [Rhizopus delemar]|nr:hypothetical protein G6F44_011177 [Rhizopus delemar]